MATETVAGTCRPATLIRVDVTAAMEREFQRRSMFPALRLQNAYRVVGAGTGVYFVGLALAREILEDAKAMREKASELPQGVPKSYTALVKKLTTALRHPARPGWDAPSADETKQGAWDAPDIDEMRRRKVKQARDAALAAGYGPNVVALKPSDVPDSAARTDTAAVIELLRELLWRAANGDLVGIGCIVYHDDGSNELGLAGVARDNRRMASEFFSRAADLAWPHGPTHVIRQDGVCG